MNFVLAVTGVASTSLAILGICVVIGVHLGDRVQLGSVPAGALAVVKGAEEGTCPAWQLPYDEFTALADAVGWLDPSPRELFETPAACDLLLACLLDGDQAMATDVLTDDDTRDMTVALLRWAI